MCEGIPDISFGIPSDVSIHFSWVPVSIIEDREMLYRGEPLSVQYKRARFRTTYAMQDTKVTNSRGQQIKVCVRKIPMMTHLKKVIINTSVGAVYSTSTQYAKFGLCSRYNQVGKTA